MSKVHVKVLKNAIKSYRETKDLGLCYHLRYNKNRKGEDRNENQAITEIQKHINKLLGHHVYLESWLESKHNIQHNDMKRYVGYISIHKPKLVATRIAWANWLIEYWKDKP